MLLKFQIVTLSGIKFDEEVYEVLLPAADGQITILPNHMPLVSLVVPGVIAVRRSQHDRDSKLEYFATDGGVIEVLDNTVRILADEVVHEKEIHEEAVKQAMIEAQRAYKSAKDQVGLNKAKANIDRQAVRLNLANMRRKHQR